MYLLSHFSCKRQEIPGLLANSLSKKKGGNIIRRKKSFLVMRRRRRRNKDILEGEQNIVG